MATVSESLGYVAGIYQLETTDPVEAGPLGISNKQAAELASRTKWLKDRVDTTWVIGDVKEVDCSNAYIAANFDGTGLGINERTGWAICNGQNGTKDRSERVSVGFGGSFTTMGATGGSKDAVVVSHNHTQTAHSHKQVYGDVDGSGSGSTTAGALKRGVNFGNDSNYDLRGGVGETATKFDTSSVSPTIQSTGESGTGKNMQPYIVTLFIQKIA